MKKSSVLLLVFFTITLCQAQTTRSMAIGSSLPMGDTKMKNISGKEVSIKDAMQQNGVLVMFSCNTCPYVVKNQSRTKMITAYARQNNIGVILLNSNEGGRDGGDSFSAMQAYAKDQKYTWSYHLRCGRLRCCLKLLHPHSFFVHRH